MEHRLLIHTKGQIREMNFPINLTKSSQRRSCGGKTVASVPQEMSNCDRYYTAITVESPLGVGVTVGTAVRFATAISPKDHHIRYVPECNSTPTPFYSLIFRPRTSSECRRDPSFSLPIPSGGTVETSPLPTVTATRFLNISWSNSNSDGC